jgi:phosphoenolpyruvate carboxykinase (ATP)
MPLHPKVYASLLEGKIKEHNTCVWLVNTGWIGGTYNVGRRIPLRYTRSLIDAVIKNQIDPNDANRFKKHEIFQFQQLTDFDGIPSHVLNPREGWKNDTEYICQARELAKSFHRNFEQFQAQVASTFAQAGPITDTP